MKEFNFYTNVILTSIALILILVNFAFNNNDQANIGILVALGIFQICTSIILTIYSVIKNPKLTALYLIYWIIVILFFKFAMRNYFYVCILIAFYNLYVNYCSFSKSKYNITNYDTTI